MNLNSIRHTGTISVIPPRISSGSWCASTWKSGSPANKPWLILGEYETSPFDSIPSTFEEKTTYLSFLLWPDMTTLFCIEPYNHFYMNYVEKKKQKQNSCFKILNVSWVAAIIREHKLSVMLIVLDRVSSSMIFTFSSALHESSHRFGVSVHKYINFNPNPAIFFVSRFQFINKTMIRVIMNVSRI